MSLLSTAFMFASEARTGFEAEQIIYRRGFHEIGRRTDAVAWSHDDANAVIRISRDAEGSEAFFSLAQRMQGNPYMPIVMGQKTLPSGDHVAMIERLENPSHRDTYPRFKELHEQQKNGLQMSLQDRGWYEEMKYAALTSSSLRHFFSTMNFHLDIDALPEPAAFKEAAIAITELSTEMNKKDPSFVPAPDINETNVMWRRVESGLQPVLYDSVSIWRGDHDKEQAMATELRRRLGMQALPS